MTPKTSATAFPTLLPQAAPTPTPSLSNRGDWRFETYTTFNHQRIDGTP